jgi:thiamine phosphate synthase YjbQ (UPF0047 family)
VLIQEQSDDVSYYVTQLLLQDMVHSLGNMFPTCHTQGQYGHPGPLHIEIAQRERGEEPWWSLNIDAHLHSVLLERSESIPIVERQMTLGEFGYIYFADFDQVRARQRTVRGTDYWRVVPTKKHLTDYDAMRNKARMNRFPLSMSILTKPSAYDIMEQRR